MNIKATLFLLVLLSGSFSLLSQNEERLTISENNYSLSYPSDWEVDRSGQMNTLFILFSPLSSPSDYFKENVNLIIQDLKGYDIDLDQYVEISENQINTLIKEGKLISSTRMPKADDMNTEYHKTVFTGKEGIFDLKFVQYYWVENESAYVVTFTSEVKSFEAFQESGLEILNSFRISQ